ncbi:hypothetical protein B0H16DRAFT_1469041 [Mycena metata]|uniref:Uncharacterized protein n=1 Tax=Mycena metata TaxID=1033252 RepID=A0AAD7I1D6_9AGAR|nr:hypothetical protein B0H16DRAFT_1469041 [Mycena metata]
MGNRSITDTAKVIGLRLLHHGRDTRKEISTLCGYSTRTLRRASNRFRSTGSVAKAAAIGCGRPRLLHTNDSNYLTKLARHNPYHRGDKRVEVYHPFVRKHRFTAIAALALDVGIIAARIIEDSSDRPTFVDFLRNDLVAPNNESLPLPRKVSSYSTTPGSIIPRKYVIGGVFRLPD